MIRMIAVDLDDTLIAPDKTIPQANKDAVRRAQAAGLQVVIVTARGWLRTESIYQELQLDTPVIVSSGARLLDGKTGRELWARTIPLELAREVCAFSNAHEIPLRVYIGAEVWNNMEQDPLNVPRTTERLVPDLPERLQEAPYQIFTKGARHVELLLERFGEAGLGYTCQHMVYSDNIPELMILHPASTKDAALETLCLGLGVRAEEVMALGDSRNDLSMIEWAGCGVAMGWAPEAVRSRADLVTSPDNPAGVAEAIDMILRVEETKIPSASKRAEGF